MSGRVWLLPDQPISRSLTLLKSLALIAYSTSYTIYEIVIFNKEGRGRSIGLENRARESFMTERSIATLDMTRSESLNKQKA